MRLSLQAPTADTIPLVSIIHQLYRKYTLYTINISTYIYIYGMAHFDERLGLVQCRNSWGTWGQTVDDVQIEVNVEKGTKSRDVKYTMQPKEIALSVRGERVFKARQYAAGPHV